MNTVESRRSRPLFESEKRIVMLAHKVLGLPTVTTWPARAYFCYESTDLSVRSGLNVSYQAGLHETYYDDPSPFRDSAPQSPVIHIFDVIPFPKHGQCGIAVSFDRTDFRPLHLSLFSSTGPERDDFRREASRVIGCNPRQCRKTEINHQLKVCADFMAEPNPESFGFLLGVIVYSRWAQILVLPDHVLFVAFPKGFDERAPKGVARTVFENDRGCIKMGQVDGEIEYIDGWIVGDGEYTDKELLTYLSPSFDPDDVSDGNMIWAHSD